MITTNTTRNPEEEPPTMSVLTRQYIHVHGPDFTIEDNHDGNHRFFVLNAGTDVSLFLDAEALDNLYAVIGSVSR